MSVDSSRKRSLLEDNITEDGSPLQRRKLNANARMVKTNQPPRTSQFQCFHLLLLQSLYDTDDSIPAGCLDDDSIGSVTNDGFDMSDDTVDDRLWNQARKFVKERDHLIQLKKETLRVNSVHQEALDYLEEQKNQGPIPIPSTPSSTRHGYPHEDGLLRSSSAGKHRPISSPISLSFFSSQQRRGSQSSSPITNKSPSKGFTLVAHLLQKKSEKFKAKNRAAPYAPVLQTVEEKIETLEEKLRVLNECSLSKQKRKVEDLLSRALLSSSTDLDGPESATADPFDLKSFISKLETKLSLWRLLAADLKDVVPVEEGS